MEIWVNPACSKSADLARTSDAVRGPGTTVAAATPTRSRP